MSVASVMTWSETRITLLDSNPEELKVQHPLLTEDGAVCLLVPIISFTFSDPPQQPHIKHVKHARFMEYAPQTC